MFASEGDPLSPYLFILGVDMMSRMLSLAYKGGLVQKVRPWHPGISFLLYVDDTIMLLPPNITSILRIKILIYIFELLSGL